MGSHKTLLFALARNGLGFGVVRKSPKFLDYYFDDIFVRTSRESPKGFWDSVLKAALTEQIIRKHHFNWQRISQPRKQTQSRSEKLVNTVVALLQANASPVVWDFSYFYI